jgi:hypothetical protein
MSRIDLDTTRAWNENLFAQYDVWHNHCLHLGAWERNFGIGCTSGDVDKLNLHWDWQFIDGASTRITHLMGLEIKSHGYKAYRNAGQRDIIEQIHQSFKEHAVKDPTFCYHGFYFISHEGERPSACLGCQSEALEKCDYKPTIRLSSLFGNVVNKLNSLRIEGYIPSTQDEEKVRNAIRLADQAAGLLSGVECEEEAGEIYYCSVEDFPNFQSISADEHRQLLKSVNHKYPKLIT